MKYTQEQIAEAQRIIAVVNADKEAKLAADRAAYEQALRNATAEAAEIVVGLRQGFQRLRVLQKGVKGQIRLNLFDIHQEAQNLDNETDWNSSSLYC